MPTLNLTASQSALVQQILQQYLNGVEVWAFGSRVKGGAKSHSDLDLAIISKEALSFEALAQLRMAFEDSDLPFTVDLVDFHQCSQAFQALILEQYVVLQSAL